MHINIFNWDKWWLTPSFPFISFAECVKCLFSTFHWFLRLHPELDIGLGSISPTCLQAVFRCADSKSAKSTLKLSVFFGASGSWKHKSCVIIILYCDGIEILFDALLDKILCGKHSRSIFWILHMVNETTKYFWDSLKPFINILRAPNNF